MVTLQNNITRNIIFKNISRTRPPLPRIGIVGGWDLRNTGNVQSVVNVVPNGSFLFSENGITPTQTGWTFDGIDDYAFVEVPTPVGNLTKFTVAFCLEPGEGAIYSETNTSNGNSLFMIAAGENNSLVVEVVENNGTSATLNFQSFFDGWTSGTLVYQDGIITAFKNGEFFGFRNISSSNLSLDLVSIGSTVRENISNSYDGTISFVFVYDRKLNDREIKRLHEFYFKLKMAAVGIVIGESSPPSSINPFSSDFSSDFGSGYF